MTYSSSILLASSDWFGKITNYEIIRGNAIWRFGLMLIIILVSLAAGRIVQFITDQYANRLVEKKGHNAVTLLLKALSNPIYVAVFALGILLCKTPLYFNDETGIRTVLYSSWNAMAKIIASIALAYGLYRLVDVAEYYLNRLVGRTETKLDDMLVPILRKTLRIVIIIVAVLMISENLLGLDKVRALFLSAGVGGIAVALAAKDTIANFFGSITIFADRPFHIGDLVRIDEHLGPVEEVGFRSSRIRTLDGHLVTIPNSIIANTTIENVGQRPFIRRTSNITITYDSGHTKATKAVEIIKEVLCNTPEVNKDTSKPPRVYFSDFNDWSLNIYMSYWVKPPDYWIYQEVNERINIDIMKRFDEAQIEFAFPSQTLYLKKE